MSSKTMQDKKKWILAVWGVVIGYLAIHTTLCIAECAWEDALFASVSGLVVTYLMPIREEQT